MVHILTTTALLALLAGFPTAAPAAKSQPPITPNTQSCVSVQELKGKLSYTVQIGVSYAHGAGCQFIDRTIGLNVLQIPGDKQIWENFYCWDDGNGDTLLKFTTYWNRAWQINEALNFIYPMVNGFNCPQA
ncbi:hypothetical protein LTR17_005503 [Elasticomyces elasticus]|nr:hypothetical protein LTR17_005503 [Elasticomyces elasticus]